MFNAEQKKEIETIRERTITVKLSDADCKRVSRLCGKHNLTLGQLIENFIGDLVDGTYSNGSDERELAERWFKRCWFGTFPEKTLLSYLLSYSCCYDVEGFLDLLEELEDVTDYWKQCQEESDTWSKEDIELAKTDYETTLKGFEEVKAEYLQENPDANWEEEVRKVIEWHKREIDF